MMRALVLVSLAACATATADHRASSADVDAAVADDGAPALDGSGSAGCSFTGALATWDLATQSGSEVQVVAGMMAPGVAAGALARSAAITPATGAGSINSTNWPSQAQPDSTRYYKLTIAPPSGCSLKITALSLDLKASTSGPAAAAIASSVDAFAATTGASTSTPSTPTLAITSADGVELHIYGFSATSTAGTLRVQGSLVIHGSLQ